MHPFRIMDMIFLPTPAPHGEDLPKQVTNQIVRVHKDKKGYKGIKMLMNISHNIRRNRKSHTTNNRMHTVHPQLKPFTIYSTLH